MEKRYKLEVKKAGTRMDDTQLFRLNVIDTSPDVSIPEYLRIVTYEELTKEELQRYTEYFESLN
jgi:hypothetical protein